MTASAVPLHPNPRAFWRDTLALVRPDWRAAYADMAPRLEATRPTNKAKTGTVSEAAYLYLRALCRRFVPSVVIEVGTFIGTSALAMAAESGHVYTCDRDNDCLPSSDRVTCHPGQSSTQMLRALVQLGVRSPFMFWDGRIQDADLRLIAQCSKPETIFAFDDYLGGEKGVVNVRRLAPTLPNHVLVPPPTSALDVPSSTTIALLVPA